MLAGGVALSEGQQLARALCRTQQAACHQQPLTATPGCALLQVRRLICAPDACQLPARLAPAAALQAVHVSQGAVEGKALGPAPCTMCLNSTSAWVVTRTAPKRSCARPHPPFLHHLHVSAGTCASSRSSSWPSWWPPATSTWASPRWTTVSARIVVLTRLITLRMLLDSSCKVSAIRVSKVSEGECHQSFMNFHAKEHC